MMPFPIAALQVGGANQFAAEFESACEEQLKIGNSTSPLQRRGNRSADARPRRTMSAVARAKIATKARALGDY